MYFFMVPKLSRYGEKETCNICENEMQGKFFYLKKWDKITTEKIT